MRAQALLVLLLEAQVLDALLLTQDLRVALSQFFPQRYVLAVERQLRLLPADAFPLLLLCDTSLLELPLLLLSFQLELLVLLFLLLHLSLLLLPLFCGLLRLLLARFCCNRLLVLLLLPLFCGLLCFCRSSAACCF